MHCVFAGLCQFAPQRLAELDAVALDNELVSDTVGVLLKYQDDIERMQCSTVSALLDEVKAELKSAE